MQVQYFSETKQRWVETLVLRMFELDPAVRWHAVPSRMWLSSAKQCQEGNICYDLDCKKGVSADKATEFHRCAVCIDGGIRPSSQVRSSPRASQERYEVPRKRIRE